MKQLIKGIHGILWISKKDERAKELIADLLESHHITSEQAKILLMAIEPMSFHVDTIQITATDWARIQLDNIE